LPTGHASATARGAQQEETRRKAGLPLPVLKLRRQVGGLKAKATGNPTERASTGMRVSMPKPVFDDNDENEVEVHK
jgi:hypothetical protein